MALTRNLYAFNLFSYSNGSSPLIAYTDLIGVVFASPFDILVACLRIVSPIFLSFFLLPYFVVIAKKINLGFIVGFWTWVNFFWDEVL